MLKPVFSICLLFSCVSSQDFTLSLWGIPCGTIEMDYNHSDSLSFAVKSTGVIDAIWPFENTYDVIVDSQYLVQSFEKHISQKSFKSTYRQIWDGKSTVYTIDKKDTLERKSSMVNIFSLLAMVQNLDQESMDTKWFQMDHEGEIYRARFLWADSNKIFVNNDSLRCDHYRLDLVKGEGGRKVLDPSDYFMENITMPDMVRQLWITRTYPKKIVKATVSQGVFKLEANIDE